MFYRISSGMRPIETASLDFPAPYLGQIGISERLTKQQQQETRDGCLQVLHSVLCPKIGMLFLKHTQCHSVFIHFPDFPHAKHAVSQTLLTMIFSETT